MLKSWWSTVMDDAAYGVHQGMTMQMEHTPRIHRWKTCKWRNTKDPLTDEAVMSCELLISYMICAEWLKMEYFTLRILFQSWYTKDPPWQMTLQMEQGSTDGWCIKQSTHRAHHGLGSSDVWPSKRSTQMIHWWITQYVK